MSDTFGRYTVIRQLGRGAMGVVYLASDPLLNRQVAVKTVDLGADMEPDDPHDPPQLRAARRVSDDYVIGYISL